MTTIDPRMIQVEIPLRLVAPDATALPVRGSFIYDPADPYAISVTFSAEADSAEADSADAVTWTLSRELLAAGLGGPSGLGDVRVWPWQTARGDFVALALASPDGCALFEVPRLALVRFMRRTYIVVPRGCETDHLDVDGAISRLLADQEY
ncbi:MAG TPA: SsgA family sporulation/cell division regulator [Candidatus Saccharimonas sp.]|nr:SsgA family sporulation/cell division regulator [Candidatus Saccharimonas sp.]